MLLDLREIINIPGEKVTFDYEPDLSEAVGGSVTAVDGPSRAVGQVKNIAGVLTFTADVETELSCVCARCLREFKQHVSQHISAVIAELDEDSDDSELYPLDGDDIDTDDIIISEFLLNLDQRLLCSDDCKGLCIKCGADLNEGPCKCNKEIDPRLAVLGQLLGD
ncbi:MAG: DUF177 domain-containing protein [Oscillospiraceae bacterium]|nr:DUF177 domain-containing protein [Oscillospiraceae bacterium]